MSRTLRAVVVLVLAVQAVASARASARQAPSPNATPAARAVGFLAGEVPRWRREHPCYSCHNNGDGLRALAEAARLGIGTLEPVGDATAWVRTPERWAADTTEGGIKDAVLSRIQFMAALAAVTHVDPAAQTVFEQSATPLVNAQRADGTWPISVTGPIGTPTRYGTPLATAVARQVLVMVGTPAARGAVARADAWFRRQQPETVLEASAVLLGLDTAADAAAVRVRERALTVLREGQGPDGGWGPYTTSPSEVFDTAVAVLALSPLGNDTRAARLRGLQFLRDTQLEDGSWPETTRPSGQESYSQRISTTAWALRALLTE